MKTGYARIVSGERALPEQASLRYLKVEAKRRRAAGEFPTLHHAQLAIAREHGQPRGAPAIPASPSCRPAAGCRSGNCSPLSGGGHLYCPLPRAGPAIRVNVAWQGGAPGFSTGVVDKVVRNAGAGCGQGWG